MEHRAAVRGDQVRMHAELLHEIVHALPQELAVGAVEGDELQGRHLLHLLPQCLFQLGRIVVSAGAVNVEGPLSVLIIKSGAANVETVDGSTGHEADTLNGKRSSRDVHNFL